ncbi:MAG: hypothetical protein R2751_13885 [Bacteroidales bacterium]
MRINSLSQKRLHYRVYALDGKELMKFYNRKVAQAFAIDSKGVLIHSEITARMRKKAS